jgi:hypothetical protein
MKSQIKVAELRDRADLQLRLLGVSQDAQAELRRQLSDKPHDMPMAQRCEEVVSSSIIAQPTDSGLVVEGPQGAQVAALYCVSALLVLDGKASAAALLEGQSLLAESLFIMGRDSMKTAVLKREAVKRSANAKKGAPTKRFPDEELRRLRLEWIQTRGHERGWIKEAARRLDVTEKTVSTRWKDISGSS